MSLTAAPARVLHVIQSLGVGGMEKRIMRLASGLDPARYAIDVVSLRPRAAGELPWPGRRQLQLPIPPGLHLSGLRALARLISDGGYDIVHSHNWSTMLYGTLAARLAGTPIVLHGEHGPNEGDWNRISARRNLACTVLARMATRVVTVNRFIADLVGERWRLPEPRIANIPNGVDLTRFRPQASGSGGMTIGTVARFDGIKNLPLLVAAFERLCDARPDDDLRLLLVGDGPERQRIAALAAASRHGARIVMPGETNRPEDWYRQMDVYVNCSYSEGMSNTILEAMACGLPVIASRVPGNACWLREGEGTLFFASDDGADLERCLLRLALAPAERAALGRQSRQRAEAEFDNRAFIARYDALYTELLGSRR